MSFFTIGRFGSVDFGSADFQFKLSFFKQLLF
jgi:hypothetical protein